MEGFGGEVHDVGVGDQVGSQLGVEDVCCCFADVGQVGNQTMPWLD